MGRVCNALLTKFGPSSYDDPIETLIRLKQYSAVEGYRGKFEAISNRLRGIYDHNKLSCFLSDLKYEIQLPVKMFNLTTLLEAFGLAKSQKEHVLTGRRNYRSSPLNYSTSNMQKVVVNTGNQGMGSAQKVVVPIQKIYPFQMEERRKNGLCYNCDSKWSPRHRCVAPKLFIIESVQIVDNEITM
jgi:hypothetical protein